MVGNDRFAGVRGQILELRASYDNYPDPDIARQVIELERRVAFLEDNYSWVDVPKDQDAFQFLTTFHARTIAKIKS